MLQVNCTESHGYTVYSFETRGVSYEVLIQGSDIQVYSKRNTLSGRTPPKCYDSLHAMSKQNKALAQLADLIQSPSVVH